MVIQLKIYSLADSLTQETNRIATELESFIIEDSPMPRRILFDEN
ncbi:hypothetical protein K4I03_0271 [Streptococcus sanguinis]|nr:hypothetical protein [Streptococcus sanguinis]